jgi:hypothetical protein
MRNPGAAEILRGCMKVMVGNLAFFFDGHYIPVYVTVILMVIDAQKTFAVWERTFPSFG